jgi:hypothetical protein
VRVALGLRTRDANDRDTGTRGHGYGVPAEPVVVPSNGTTTEGVTTHQTAKSRNRTLTKTK